MESALCALLSALVVLLCSSVPECKGQDTVTQTEGHVSATQGHSAHIHCHYTTSGSYPRLFWYKQEDGSFPKYIMNVYREYSKQISPEFDTFRFDADLSSSSVVLKIQDVCVADSAVYYCALQPTVTGNSKTLNKNLCSKDNTILH